jgi:hypothetical protein
MTSIETENTSNKIPRQYAITLFARTECMKTVVFAARRKEGVVGAPVGVTNNMTVCYVSVKYI